VDIGPQFGGDAVAGRDGGATLGRAHYGEDADQPATAQRHEDRVAHVVLGRVRQRAHRLHRAQRNRTSAAQL